jgi:hypothetical protein
MQIKSSYPKKIFWRIFDRTDTAFVVGREEGTVDPRGTGTTKNTKSGDIVKLEVKEDGLFGRVLLPASKSFLYSDMAAVEVGTDGKLTFVSGATVERWARAVVYYFAGNTELGRTYEAKFAPAVGRISWRRYSALPPFYTFGDHDMSQPFSAVMVMPFTEVWFNQPQGVQVTWTPHLDVKDIPPPAPLPGPLPDPS